MMDKKKSRVKVKLVQLPIPEVHRLYSEGNIPLAAGYLKSFALKKGRAREHEIEILPRDPANNGGDAAILKWLLHENENETENEKPGTGTEIVGFTSYMWNIDRNIYLAQKIKEANPGIVILFGGPEIDSRHPALNDEHIDAFVLGEGERAFVDFLKDYRTGKGPGRLYRGAGPVDLNEVANPYLEKILLPSRREPLFLETMRGCPYRCKYCFYSKTHAGLRFFPAEDLTGLFALARDYEVPEIYFMDPSFNVTPGLEEKLAFIRRLNSTAIPVHTEIRLEAVTPGIARSMRQAGFKSVEAGLQSTNEKSLAAIGRNWNKEKFTRGAELLRQQGIDVKTGVILGLPYDTPGDFLRTLDFVVEAGLAEAMEIYPLSLLPGTRLRDEAEALHIAYMPQPPYWVLQTPSMKEQEIKNTIEMIEQKLAIEFFPPIIPRFDNDHPEYLHFLDLRENAAGRPDDLYRRPGRVGHSLTVLLDGCDITGPAANEIMELGRWLRQVSPFTLVQLVLERDTVPPAKEIRRLSEAFYFPRHYFNHIHRYKIGEQQTYSLRFFHLTGNMKVAESYRYRPRYCDLVLRYSPGLLGKQRAKDILGEKPLLLVDSPIPGAEAAELKKIYEGFENLLIFKIGSEPA